MASCTTSFCFSRRSRHTRYWRDWSSDVCSSDLDAENLAPVFFEHRRRERAKPLAQFHLVIQNLAHIRTARIRHKASRSEGARSPFHPALEPDRKSVV